VKTKGEVPRETATAVKLVRQINGKNVYKCSDGDLTVEEDHMYLRKLTELELRECEEKCEPQVLQK